VRARRRGIAGALNDWVEQRARSLRRNVLERMTAFDNRAMRALYETRGYVLTRWSPRGLIYSKRL
jgi:hypothetical protein